MAKRPEADAQEDEGVVLDFGRLTYQDMMELTRLNSLAVKPTIIAERMKRGTITDADLLELERLTSGEFLQEQYDLIRCLMAKTVVELPNGWIVADAPKGMNYNDPELYRWLRGDLPNRLRQMITDGTNKAKN